MSAHWKHYDNIQKDLQAVLDLIEERVTVRNQQISEAFVQLSQAGGKLLRPAFFFLFSQIGDHSKQDLEQLHKIGASLELLHMASLIHDDIIDDSPLRRGLPSIQSRYGKDVAVYAGDLLFTTFFELVAEAIDEQDYLVLNAQSMRRLLLGELDQMNSRFNPQESLEDYLTSINGKTAELFSLSCQEGAHFGVTSSDTEVLASRIGRSIGIAFQINDDILDYTSNSEKLKKPTLEDLSQGVYTLPLLLAKEKAPAAFAGYFSQQGAIDEEALQHVAQQVIVHDGISQAKDYAKKYTQQALDDIEKLPDCLAKQQLAEITRGILERNY